MRIIRLLWRFDHPMLSSLLSLSSKRMTRLPIVAAALSCWGVASAQLPIATQSNVTYRRVAQYQSDSIDLSAIRIWVPRSDGGIVGADSRASGLRFFDRELQLKRTVGRLGEAPGEFRQFAAAGLHHDTLWVSDGSLRRLTLIRNDGRVYRVADLRPVLATSKCGAGMPWAILRSGRFVAGERVSAAQLKAGLTSTHPVLTVAADYSECDTVRRIARGQSVLLVGTGSLLAYQPFDDAALATSFANGSGLIVVSQASRDKAGDGGSYQVAVSDSTGVSWREKNVLVRLRPAGRNLRDSVRQEAERLLVEMRSSAAEARAVLDEQLLLPDYMPPVSGVVASGTGDVWVQREKFQRTLTYDIYSPRLALRGRLTLPSQTRVLAAYSNHFWTLTERDDGEVVLHRLLIERWPPVLSP